MSFSKVVHDRLSCETTQFHGCMNRQSQNHMHILTDK